MPLATVDEAHASLQVISREITAELNEARIALETFAERPDDRGALHRFAAHIHLARGALRLAEVYGGALLAEEMEFVARYVDAHSGEGRADSDGLDALMRAMEQLPAYVERVATGARDLPLVLLPLLNDLRAVRGGALLSEGTLLLLNLRSDAQPQPVSPYSGDREVAELARRLRPRFQIALLGWIRGEQVTENLHHLAEIAAQFERAASTQPLYQLWWVVGALVEALQSGGVAPNVSVKRVLGHVDRELKRLQEGEQRYASSPPAEVLNNLLYYVAQSSVAGERVGAVRHSFGLHDMVAAKDAATADSAEVLSAPSVRLMRTVAAAIREDLTRVKDVLDIFVRKGATHVDDLQPQLEMLRKISDTLGVLGLGALRARVEGELDSLRAIVDRRTPPNDATLLSIAAALIAVEDSLDAQLVRLILPDAGADAAAGEPADEEFRLVQEAVLRECIVNMARIKEAVTQSLSAPAEAQGLDQVPQLVRGITAGLLMLGKQRAVEVMERVGRALGTIVRPDDESLHPARLERLADAVVAVEYYMETLQSGRADQWHMLDAADARLAEMDPAGARVSPLRDARPDEPAPGDAGAEAASARVPVAQPTGDTVAGISAPPATSGRPQVAPAADPEFLQLFVEEARENVARLEALYPQWETNPQDIDALRDLRRAFHTLKGSGRMVGAQRIGEFSWSVESLLNRVISQTLLRSPAILFVVRDAVAAMPQLVDEIDGGTVTSVDIAAIMARADALSGREGPALPATATPPPLPPPPVVAAPAEPMATTADDDAGPATVEEPSMDPVLREIFRKETAGHIQVVRQYLERCARGAAPHPVTEALYRACHTLSGIAKTAGARQGIKVAEPMEHFVRKLFDNGHGMGADGLELLHETVRLLETVSEHVDENTGFFPEQTRLTASWIALERQLDAELARLAEAAERTLGDAWRGNPPVQTPPSVATEHSTPLPAEEFTEPSLPRLSEDELRALGPDPDHTAPHVTLAESREVEPLPEPVLAAPAQAFELQLPDADPEPPLGEDFDADIAAIFGEEATELLEQSEAAFSRWRADRADFAQVTELKRLLHTLKGGARMAGIRAMGDLSHEVESFFAAIESGAVQADGAALEVLQSSLDELHRMREMANSGQRIPAARELILRLRGLSASPAAAGETFAGLTVEARDEEPVAGIAAPAADEHAAEPHEEIVLEEPLHEEIVLEAATDELVAEVEFEPFADEPLAEASIDAGFAALVELPGEPLATTAAEDEFAAIFAAEPEPQPATAADVPVTTTIATSVEAAVASMADTTAAPTAEDAELPAPAAELPATTAPPPPTGPFPPAADFGAPAAAAPPATRFVIPAAPPREVAGVEIAAAAHAPVLPGREPVAPVERAELARVDADLLDELLNNAGEVSIFRARIEQQMTSIEFNLAELDRTVTRLRDQLRKLEMETEAQILNKHQAEAVTPRTDFDPLELDRYSNIQQLSRALAESVSDVGSIEDLLAQLNRETQNLLQQQGRVVTEVQNGLMRTRMVPFQRHVQRLTRLLRQAATEAGKKAELIVEGAAGELDRQVLERMLPPFEHMLRNAVVHGLETPAARIAAGKPETGHITLKLQREGAEVVITVEDDGAGLDVAAIHAKALQMGLLQPGMDLTEEESLQLILEPGFSTADRLTQQAGRGVGMDVVATEIKKLGGALFIESKRGVGARFTIRLPFTLAITQALIVRVHDELFALPMATVEGVSRLTRSEIQRHLGEEPSSFTYGGNPYRFQHLGTFVGSGPSILPETDVALPVILVRAGEHSTALVTDELIGSREIVVKPVGPQIASIRGISGATILGDGRIVVILDMGTLVRSEWRARGAESGRSVRDDRIFAMVVDDSITVRRVTQRLLERNGMRVITAKDGVEAMALLQEHVPDVILLDIEMPRMDGYEVAAHVRNDARIADVPIIMITSRAGDKHRARAIELGVDDYLGKPYQESQLLDAIEPLVLARRRLS
jgi:chemosensory pili system protein ChpA (sensor histidine kinase/response regulator)